jgi:hypothetical protein
MSLRSGSNGGVFCGVAFLPALGGVADAAD